MSLASHTNFRVRGIPLVHEKKDSVRQLIRQTLDLDPTTIISVHSVAVSPSDCTSRIATLSFPQIPACFLDKSKNEWPFHVKDGEDLDLSSSIVFDTHFRGFTPFQRASSDDCHGDIIAVTGLGGHALGSFKQKNGPFVWLRDGLSVDAPDMRILSYGYDTTIINSSSFQNLTDLARSLQLDLEGIQDKNHPRPIVFIAHSLGGLLVKETIVQMKQEPIQPSMLDLISSFMFFGVPHQGLAVECLVPMIKDSPNRALLESLGKNSPLLCRLQRDFSNAIGTKCCQVVSFYETERSSTAQQVQGGRWEMSGPSEVLVEVSSANCGSLRQHPINRNHSEMVKLGSRQDDLYRRVVLALKPLLVEARSLQTDRGAQVRHAPFISLSDDEKSCLRSLSFQEQDHRYAKLRYDKGTCEWLLEDPRYQAWLNAPRGLFWIKGSPGTGKSVLMKFAVEAMQRRKPTDLVVSFFIQGGGVLLQRTPLGVFRALLSSLLGSFPTYLQEITQRFKYQEERFGSYERKDGWVWTDSELESFLLKLLSEGTETHPIVVFVDALDECEEDDAKRLFRFFNRIMSIANKEEGLLKICVSSRHYPILGLETIPALLVENHNGGDIRLVTKSRLQELKLHGRRHQIEYDILSKAQGGFQWAILVIDIIRNGILCGLNGATLHQAVTTIPKDLQRTYDFILSGAETEDIAHMVNLFQWVLFSERPLSAHELREALTTRQDMNFTATSQLRLCPSYSDTVSDFELWVRHISRGLVEFQNRDVWEIYQTDGDNWDREAHFIHRSAADFVVQKFLVQHGFGPTVQSVAGVAHFEISRSCLKYMLLQDILESNQLSRRDLSADFPLLPYAVTFLLRHIMLVEESGMTQTDLLDLIQWHRPHCLRRFSALWLKMDPDRMHAPMGWPFVGATASHMLVGLGSLSALQAYLNHNTVKFHVRDSYGNTPLLLALREGREDLALLLLDQSIARQANKRAVDGEASHLEQLGEEVDYLSHVSITNLDGETPLGVAVSIRAHEAIQSLLRAGADAETERGLLFYAIDNFDKLLLCNLMERKMCLDGAVFFAVQILRGSIQSDHETTLREILCILLNAGANARRAPGVVEQFNLESLDYEEREDEAIIVATHHNLASVIELLISHGISPAVRDINGYHPMQIAARNRRDDILELLSRGFRASREVAQYGIDDFIDEVIEHRDPEVVAVLLRNLYRDGVPSRFLTKCITYQNFELMQSILQSENGIQGTIEDFWPEQALWRALEVPDDQSYKIVEILLRSRKFNLSANSHFGKKPLRRCLGLGRADLVGLILETDNVDIHENDRDGESPFWWTMRKGYNSVIELLLGLDKRNIHLEDSAGRTAFWWLTQGRHYNHERVAIAEAALDGKHWDRKAIPKT